MTEPVDPIAPLDFVPTCDWGPAGEVRCREQAIISTSWSCGCVMLACGLHALPLGRRKKVLKCPRHGAAAFVGRSVL